MPSLARSLAPVAAVTGASAVLILSFDSGVAAMVGDHESGGVSAAAAPGATSGGTGGKSAGGSAAGSSGSAGSCSGQEITGPVANTQYGPVQVAAKVSNGQVCSVRTLQFPNYDGESIQINAQAIPMLEQQVAQSGDASFAGVSGATYTTDGYRQSLQAILDQAQ